MEIIIVCDIDSVLAVIAVAVVIIVIVVIGQVI